VACRNLAFAWKYGRINFTKSPASDASKIREPRLMSEFERVREIMFA